MVITTHFRVLCCFPLCVLKEFGTACFKHVYVYIHVYVFSSFHLTPPPNTKTELRERLK